MDENQQLIEMVRRAYSAAAERPEGTHPFPVGRLFAESVGYPADLLNGVPAVAVDSFTGVSNVSVFAEIPPGATVLDVGCGSGLDTLIAATKAGPEGKVISIDFSEAMLKRARQAAEEYGCRNVVFYSSSAEEIPIPDASVDVALVNGIFNLNPERRKVFSELARVVRDGGCVYCAELILKEPVPVTTSCSINNWFA